MPSVSEIGEAAGEVFRYLDAHGPSSLAAVERGVGESRTVLMMAVGWLAREGKVEFRQEGRSSLLALV